jgi:hypothetical protein
VRRRYHSAWNDEKGKGGLKHRLVQGSRDLGKPKLFIGIEVAYSK